jgi:hypothetical protein
MNMTDFETKLTDVLSNIKQMLVDKNRRYGNSALEPVRIFSKSSPLEQLKVRMDDKLSRLRSAQTDDDEDVVNDLIGYLLIYKIAKQDAVLKSKPTLQVIFSSAIIDDLDENIVWDYMFHPDELVGIQDPQHKFRITSKRADAIRAGDVVAGYGKVVEVKS